MENKEHMKKLLFLLILIIITLSCQIPPAGNPIATIPAAQSGTDCIWDDFNSTRDPAWQFLDPLGGSGYSLSDNPGYLRIFAPHGNRDLTPGNLNSPRMVQTLKGDFDIRTGLEVYPNSHNYQSAGILIWMGSSNYIWVGRSLNNIIAHRYMRNNSEKGLNPADIDYPSAIVHFRITRMGNTFTTYYSSNGDSWILTGSIEYPSAGPSLQVGFFIINNWQDTTFYADFDYFSINCTTLWSYLPGINQSSQPAHMEKKVLTLAYIDTEPIYDIDTHQSLLLAGIRTASTWHGYDLPDGIPSLGYSTYGGQITKIQEAPPYLSDTGKFDYAAVYDRFDICEKVQQGLVDEVWIWESDSRQAWEWVTNGPDWSRTWGSNVPNCGKTITTLNFNYQLEIDFAFESFHHRLEGAFIAHQPCEFYTRTWPWPWTGWPAKCKGLVSDAYGLVARPFSGNGFVAVCGDAHHPPNILDARENVYNDPDMTTSICKDWQLNGSAVSSSFDCEEWGCTQAGFHIWWMQNIPGYGNDNRNRNGVIMPDWWKCLFY
jgi:regulation of enolase protein 1 (concanavalin A-like superfamily)